MAEIQAAADTGWKGYSLAERDRRWNAVRANAARDGLDCVMVMKGNRIDARYLTQIMGTGYIFKPNLTLQTDPLTATADLEC